MTPNEFNRKWKNYLKEGYYGLDIHNEEVARYLDRAFYEEVEINPSFKYSQIKIKFGTCRMYAESAKKKEWEIMVDVIMENKKMIWKN
jgi:hypothetical protein